MAIDDSDNQEDQIDNPARTGADYTRPDDIDARFLITMGITDFVIFRVWHIWFALAFGLCVSYALIRHQKGRNFFRFGLWWADRRIWLRSGIFWKSSRIHRTWSHYGLTIRGIMSIGLLHKRGSDTFLVDADGWDFSSKTVKRQYGEVVELSEVIMRIASSEKKFKIGVSVMYARLPPDGYTFKEIFSPGVYHEVLIPSQALMEKNPDDYIPEEKRRMNLRLLAQGQADIVDQLSFEVRELMAITITHSGALAKAFKTRSLAEKQVNRLPVTRMVNTMLRGLADIGIVNPRVLSSDELKTWKRASCDVVGIEQHYEYLSDVHSLPTKVSPYEAKPEQQVVRNDELVKMQSRFANPTQKRKEAVWRVQDKIWTDGECLVIGDTWIGMIEMSTMPKLSWAGQFATLDALDMELVPAFIRGFISHTMRSKNEERKLILGSSLLNDFRNQVGIKADKGSAKLKDDETERRITLSAEMGFSQQSMLIVAALAPSRDLLEVALAEITRVANFEKFGPLAVTGRTSLPRIFEAVTTGIPR